MNEVVELNGFLTRARAGQVIVSKPASDRSTFPSDNVVRLWNRCPQADEVTDYDMRHLSFFGLLLTAEQEGASERHMAEILFFISFDRHRTWALNVVRTHLARAHWLKQHAFPSLDW